MWILDVLDYNKKRLFSEQCLNKTLFLLKLKNKENKKCPVNLSLFNH